MTVPVDDARDVQVKCYHQILMWPVLMRTAGPDFRHLPDDFLDRVTERLAPSPAPPGREIPAATGAGAWYWPSRNEWSKRAAPNLGSVYSENQDYSEIVYFHAFARDFLYGNGQTPPAERPLRVLRRDDVKQVRVTLAGGSHTLDVWRLEFYIFDTGAAILVVEVANYPRPSAAGVGSKPRPLTLAGLLDLQTAVRMLFPRRWNENNEPYECPRRVEWLGAAGAGQPEPPVLSAGDYTRPEDFTDIARRIGELPAAEHWQFLLRPLRLHGSDPDPLRAGQELAYQPVQDQRLPSMTYVAVDDPRQVSEWDMARLVFLDSSGSSQVGPYSEEFLKADWPRKYVYDRFWLREPLPNPGHDPAVEKHNNDMNTRWLCSGYGFAVVGSANSRRFVEHILANFHHHYFRMGLVAHFHRTSLLVMRDQLAEAAALLARGRRAAKAMRLFTDAVQKVQRAMMRFRSRCWFREISTQVQGQELFSWWSDLLGNRQLFDHVVADIDFAAEVVTSEQEAQETRYVKRLTVIATAAAFVGIVVSALTLIVPVPDFGATYLSFLPQSVLALPNSWLKVAAAFLTPLLGLPVAGLVYAIMWVLDLGRKRTR